MSNRRSGPDGAQRRSGAEGEHDTEGHGHARLGEVAATTPADEPGTGPQESRRAGAEGEMDVEGHNFGHNAMLSRNAAQSRERDVQRNLKQHDLKGEARRPFLKGR